jgi:hypothetical protein
MSTSAPAVMGEWKVLPYDSQVEAVHMALLRTGKVLYFSGFRFPEAVPCETRLWYPRIGELKTPLTPCNLLCAGHAFLPDGRLFSVGGTLEYRNPPAPPWVVRLTRPVTPYLVRLAFTPIFKLLFGHAKLPAITGPTFTYLFDPKTEQWEFAGDMEEGRWYPTATALPDGRILILSGTNEGGGVGGSAAITLNTRVETFSAEEGLRQVATLPEPEHHHAAGGSMPGKQDSGGGDHHDFLSEYPRMHVLPLSDADRQAHPAGRVFCSGYGPETRMLDIATWEWSDVATLNFGTRHDGCCVLLPLRPPDYRARVLAFGGLKDAAVSLSATDTAEWIDLGQTPPAWEYVAPLRHKRVNACAIILPDGKVLAVGGNSTAQFEDSVYDAEVFDPNLGTWSLAARMTVPRGYHSTALLLPDGRVLACGSTPYGNYELRMEVYSPYYLFKGPRPIIKSVPSHSISYGQSFEVTYDANGAGAIQSVVLIRPGATTHAFDMEQRYVALTFERQADTRLTVEAPRDQHVAPPGYYMLFILSENDVPSEAKFVHLAVRA